MSSEKPRKPFKKKRGHVTRCALLFPRGGGGELPADFTLLNYCLGLRLTQPSRIKYENKLFLINEDDLKGKPSLLFILSTLVFLLCFDFFTIVVLQYLLLCYTYLPSLLSDFSQAFKEENKEVSFS